MASGAEAVASKLAAISERLQNMQPALEVFGAWLVKTTDDSFRGEKEHDGSPFEQLKPATINARIRKAGGFRRKKQGEYDYSARDADYTKGALKKQAKMLAPGDIKILTDTARARNSQHYVASPNKLVYSVVGYLGAHMSGTADIPRRNPTAFDREGDKWKLGKRGTDKLRDVIGSYVNTGRARP